MTLVSLWPHSLDTTMAARTWWKEQNPDSPPGYDMAHGERQRIVKAWKERQQ